MGGGFRLLRSAELTRQQLIIFALISAILNGIVTAGVGAWLAQTYATQQTRRKSIEAIANLIYDRRTRAGMVVSSMRRNAPLDEIQFRKRAYDEAYVDWNKNILLNLFVIREVGGDFQFTALEHMFEDNLVAAMADVDRCLTTAYDSKLAGSNPVPILDTCRMAELHQFVLDCGATFTDELDKLTSFSFAPFSHGLAERKRLVEANIKANCTRTPEAPAPTTPATAAAAPPATTAATPAASPPQAVPATATSPPGAEASPAAAASNPAP